MSTNIARYKYTGDEKFDIQKFKTNDSSEVESREEAAQEFVDNLLEINKWQQKLYAERKEGLIFIFQAMDAAGKDGVIRTVFSTLSPHGVKEYCFKVPSSEESSHDFLWRFWQALPMRGNISIFNRSYYEDVLVGKVHELWKNQTLPERVMKSDVIGQRYLQINDYEKYLYQTGTRVVKIFLNVSKDEQARRFISRIDTPKKNWKISTGDIKEREYWDDYMDAFETMVNNTSSELCPWYVVPADHKWYARLIVSRIVLKTLEEMNPDYPDVSDEEAAELQEIRQSVYDSMEDKGEIESPLSSKFTDTEEIAAGIVIEDETAKIKSSKEEKKKKKKLKKEAKKKEEAEKAALAESVLKDTPEVPDEIIPENAAQEQQCDKE
ncbi:MAG: polyphosphate kinase 2 family protein [Eubacteriales bacterium]|nr:polyphosphate kinase 2 family protein [Eubacteriales bacterium]